VELPDWKGTLYSHRSRSAGRMRRALIAACLTLLSVPVLAQPAGDAREAQAAALGVAREPDSSTQLRVYLMTMGPGDQVWERFGHNAIWIHDPATGSDLAFNYGIFSFDQPGFLGRLLRGDMLYTMAPYDASATVNAYAAYDRAVWVQELNLTVTQKRSLYDFLLWNARPENANYRYDYFRDNCSTRVRDAIDRVLGGALRGTLGAIPTGSTYRSESLRLTHNDMPVSAGLLLAMGPEVDRPLSAWEESFVPMRLSEHIAGVRVPAAEGLIGGNGVDAPLVAGEWMLYVSGRPPLPAESPGHAPWFLLIGLGVAGTIVGLRLLSERADRRGGRIAFATVAAGWAGAVGFLGLLIVLLWVGTGHTVTYRNVNVLLANPLSLLVAGLIVAGAVGRGGAWQWAARVSFAVAALALLGVLLSLTPLLQQYNGPIIALLVPPQLAAAWALYPWRRGALSTAGDTPLRAAPGTARR
jgi:hypothetical protein